MFSKLASLAALLPVILACADHSNYDTRGELLKRQDSGDGNWTIRIPGQTDWAYEFSFNWGRLNPDYELCQTGTQQSPISLRAADATNMVHMPRFTGYKGNWAGNFFNWGYGPAFTLSHEPGVYTTLPSMQVDNTTVYMTGWHIHAPGDHMVDGDRTKAELHFVHVDAEGHEKAVLGFLMDPAMDTATANSTWVDQFPSFLPTFNETDRQLAMDMQFDMALDEVDRFSQFWTYKGSLTSPPCHEGIRWFVAKDIMQTSVAQMQEILRISTYSARQRQEEWLHAVNK
ncbi:hypothetical protein GTA08_BOTSDO02703 [Neofusicoccum parvum]|nr:hypothetical protein GTA08_BOTSDO02703 [Neofusicoccum parvum]